MQTTRKSKSTRNRPQKSSRKKTERRARWKWAWSAKTATRSEESATEVATNDGENVESRGVEEVPMATAPLVTEYW